MANTKSSNAKSGAKNTGARKTNNNSNNQQMMNQNMMGQMQGQMYPNQNMMYQTMGPNQGMMQNQMYPNQQMQNNQMMQNQGMPAPMGPNQGMMQNQMYPNQQMQNNQMMQNQSMPAPMGPNQGMMQNQMYPNQQMQNNQMMQNQGMPAPMGPNQGMMQNQMYPNQQMMYQQQMPSQSPIKKTDVVNFFKYILNVLYKPISTFKENAEKFCSAKNTLIFSSIIIGIAMVFNVLIKLITTSSTPKNAIAAGYSAITSKLGMSSGINWVNETIVFFLVWAIAIFAIAGIFSVGGLIAKKKVNYMKAVAGCTTALIPYVAGGMVVGGLFGLLTPILGIIFSVIGGLYSFFILQEVMTTEMGVEGNAKIHILVGCFAVTAIVLFIVLIITGISAGASGLGNMTRGISNFGGLLK